VIAPEPAAARDAAIDALLACGDDAVWSMAALRQAAGEDAEMLFPGGASELVEAYADLMDRRMVSLAGPELPGMRLSQRVRVLVRARLELAAPHKAAVRRAVLLLCHPANAALGARCTARTVDVIWHAAGDASADFSWYTKRAILAGVYSTTLLYWLNGNTGIDDALAFLDRRLADVARLGRWRSRFANLKRGGAPA
jgi:ubiquinone biosynthesis protein COQ9